MKSETFRCPHCRAELKKSAAAFVLGEAKSSVVMGGMDPTVTCPACGGSIETQSMIEGKYDVGKVASSPPQYMEMWTAPKCRDSACSATAYSKLPSSVARSFASTTGWGRRRLPDWLENLWLYVWSGGCSTPS